MAHKLIDVIIIGAGAAGLAGARQLSPAGLRVEVIESRDRFGGRIRTLRPANSPLPIQREHHQRGRPGM